MPEITIEINPRKAFLPFLKRRERGIRWAVMMAHRRSGKTVATCQDMGAHKFTYKRKGPPKRYAYVAPTQSQAKDIVWEYFESFFGPMPHVKLNKSELKVTFQDKDSIRLYSGENYERMRGLYFDYVAMDEYDDMDPVAWPTVIRPTLSDYGGCATFMGTPKGKAALHRIMEAAKKREDWYHLLLPASESGIIDDEELRSIREDPEVTEANYQQEYECNVNVSTPGHIFLDDLEKAVRQGRVNNEIEHIEGLPVYTAFDVGLPANTKCWIFQINGDRIRFLKSLTGDGERNTPAKWTKLLTQYASELGYSYGCHFLPHDGETVWRPCFVEAGLTNVSVLPVPPSEWDDVNEAKRMFSRFWIHQDECAFGIRALESWQTAPRKKDGTYTNKPMHDWASHWCKAFAHAAWAIACGKTVNQAGRSKRPKGIKPKAIKATAARRGRGSSKPGAIR